MKTLTRIFMAVAALFAFSCTTDVTEDLGVQLGSGEGKTVISISLEESRTQLGEKADGLYPLYWSEGDKISVNGVESGEAQISAENAAYASFAVAASAPYCIAYPAANAGQVLFADKQVHSGNTTFASGVSTMYAYSESGLGVQLKHLTGVLKIGVTGSAKIVLAQISNANRKPIAGAFDFDFEKGEATATTSSKEVIEYSFGEGVQLSEEPTYIHAVVPAGEYDEVYVTLYDENGGVMYATVKADETKPLAAGKIREFSNSVSYTPNESVFVIRDVASLKAFAAEAASSAKNALFVADVDMTGEEWTPIEGYAGTIHGNGYAIKGLTAPLFGTTNASIKGLHLRDVNLVTNDTLVMGALACTATATDAIKPVIENCSVSGSLTVENKTYSPTTKDLKTVLFYGGLVGISHGVDILDCVNSASITVKQSIASNCTISALCYPSGVVGKLDIYLGTSTKVYANLDGCINRGPILIHDTTQPEGAGLVAYWMGGVVSYVSANNTLEGYIANCKNDAPITITEVNNFSGQYCQIGGVIGIVAYQASNLYEISNCENTENGDILVTGKGNTMYIGGIAGYNYNCAHKDIVNRGDVTINAEFTGLLYVAGCLSSPGLNDTDGKHHFTAENVTNYAPVSINGHGATIYLGGVLGRASQGTFTNICNYGPVSLVAKSDSMTNVLVGGVEAVGIGDGDAGHMTNCHNYGTVTANIETQALKQFLIAGFSAYCHHECDGCTNQQEGAVTISGTVKATAKGLLEDTSTDAAYCIGGFAGYKASTAMYNSANYADVYVDLTWSSDTGNATLLPATDVTAASSGAPIASIGGLNGRSNGTVRSTCSQHGNVIVKGNSENYHGVINIAGVTGCNPYGTDGYNNNGNIYVSGNHGSLFIGGLQGYIHAFKGKNDQLNGVNRGNIFVGYDENENAVATKLVKSPKIGGLAGWALNHLTDATNYGNIKINAVATSTDAEIYVSGGVAYAQKVGSAAIGNDFLNLTNHGNITIEGTIGTKSWNIGGVLGYAYNAGIQKNLENNGDILVHFTKAGTGHVRVGGVAHGIRRAIDGAVNNGDITVRGKVGDVDSANKRVGSLYIGGIIATPNGYDRDNMTNNGNILVDATVSVDCFLGGICYDAANGNGTVFKNCHNTGNIEVTKNSLVKGNAAIGGMIGKYPTANELKIFDACSNSGNISYAGKSNGSTNIGGLFGYLSHTVNSTTKEREPAYLVVRNGFVNTGNITHTGTTDGADNISIGGLLGYCSYGQFSKGEHVWTGDIINRGKITCAGSSIGGIYRTGGFIGYSNTNLPETARIINLGEIEFTGTPGVKNGTPGTAYVGGIIGHSENATITNAETYCTITAQNVDYMGFIVGTPRSTTVVASNCKVGGKTLGEWDEEDQVYDETKLSSSNYHNFIYGSGKNTDWTGTENYDGCTLLTSAPTFE